jgi:hypothetical protein
MEDDRVVNFFPFDWIFRGRYCVGSGWGVELAVSRSVILRLVLFFSFAVCVGLGCYSILSATSLGNGYFRDERAEGSMEGRCGLA